MVGAYQFGCTQLLRWQKVDPTVYREGADLPARQGPGIHIEKPWQNGVHDFAASLTSASITLMGAFLVSYALALARTVYSWRRPRRK